MVKSKKHYIFNLFKERLGYLRSVPPVLWLPTSLLLFLSLLGHNLVGQDQLLQSISSLPKIQPSYVKNISKNNIINITCFKDLLEGKDGRVWINPCGVSNVYYTLHLVQYDGYQTVPINLGNQPLLTNLATTFTGIGPNEEIIGFSLRRPNNFVFTIHPETFEVTYFDFSSFNIEGLEIRNVKPDKDGGLIVLGTRKNEIYLFAIRKKKIELIVQTTFETDEISVYQSWPYVIELPLLITDEGVWFMEEFFPLFFYNFKSKELHRINPENLPPEIWKKLSKRALDLYGIPNLVEHKSGIILYHPSYSPFFFSVAAPKAPIQVIEGFPSEWQSHALAQDLKGNTIFLFYNKEKEYQAILETPTGKRYDYSGFVNELNGRFFSIEGKDFFNHLYICVQNNLISAGVNHLEGIHTLDLPSNIFPVSTHIEQKFLFYSKRNQPLVIQFPTKNAAPVVKSSLEIPCLDTVFNANLPVIDITTDDRGIFWIGQGTQLVQYNPDHQNCHAYELGQQVARVSAINNSTIAILSDSNILYLFNTKTSKTTPIKINGIPPGHVFILHATPDSVLWAATSGGLWKVDAKSNSSEVLGLSDDFQDFRFQSFIEDRNGIFWLGTFMAGIQRFDRKTGKVKVIGKKQGLPSDVIMSMIEDSEGMIWVATNNGLSLVDAEGNVLKTITEEDGMPSNKYRRFGISKSPEGTMLFTTNKGIALVEPTLLKAGLFKNQPPGRIFLTSLTYFDNKKKREIIKTRGINNNHHIYLPPQQRYLKIEFAHSNFVNPEKNHFAYKIEGKNKDWVFIGTQHELLLNHLPAGRYRLLIKGADFRNNWTEEPIALSIRAGEFFYKQTWFYSAIISGIALFTFWWIRRLRFEKVRLESEVDKRTKQIRDDKEVIEKQAGELKQLDELKSRFFTNISHELRTPVTLISTPIDQIIKKPGETTINQLKKPLHVISNNAKKLLTLIEELLELSKIDAGKKELSYTSIHFYSFCRQLFSAYESAAQLKNIDYQLQFELPESIHLLIDKKRLEKIINNLLSNALKFTPIDGTVVMRVKGERVNSEKIHGLRATSHQLPANPPPSLLSIKVQDTGRGIPPEDLPYVFNRYFQTKRKSIPTEGGTGIGLALAKELAELMQGSLTVSSEWEKGSTFTLKLPVQIIEEAQLGPIELPDIKSPELAHPIAIPQNLGPSKQKILVVEDNPDMQQLIHSILAEHYSCVIANNGAEAWELLSKEDAPVKDIQLILSDIMMPQMDGYELLKHIKQHEKWRKVPVIMLTARAAQDDKLRALRLGVDDYLLKPFSAEELMARIANLLTNYQQRVKFLQENPPSIKVEFKTTTSTDDQWLQDLEITVKDGLNKKLSITAAFLSHELAISERQLSRKIRALTGLTVKQYTQEVRLQKARHLLENRTYNTIAEVSFECGFNTPGYFTTVFEKRYGKRPGEYLD